MQNEAIAAQVDLLVKSVPIPKLVKIRQIFKRDQEIPIPDAVHREFARDEIGSLVKPGMRIAIGVGSRGVRNIAEIAREVVANVKALGGVPYLVPAMGSHGGATIAGQLEILASMGVTEDSVHAPIWVTNDTITIGSTPSGVPVYMDTIASEADGIILINRIKPHTAFSGEYESGLMKMAVVGLGKQPGARAFHSDGLEHMARNLKEMGTVMLSNERLLCGFAILENAYDETARIVGLTRAQIAIEEPGLLRLAKQSMARLLFNKIDVLVVERIGKDISGDSMDPNITGRFYSPYVENAGDPDIQRIVAYDITDASHGNCIGVGIADFITKKLFDKIDLSQIYINALTNCVLAPAKLPLIMANEEQALKSAIATCVHIDQQNPRVVVIRDTLSLEYIQISEALVEEARIHPGIEILEV